MYASQLTLLQIDAMSTFSNGFTSSVTDTTLTTSNMSDLPYFNEHVEIINLTNIAITAANRRGVVVTIPEGRSTRWSDGYYQQHPYVSDADKEEGVYVLITVTIGGMTLNSFKSYLTSIPQEFQNNKIYDGFKIALTEKIERDKQIQMGTAKRSNQPSYSNIGNRSNVGRSHTFSVTPEYENLSFRTTFFIPIAKILEKKGKYLYDNATDYAFSTSTTSAAGHHPRDVTRPNVEITNLGHIFFNKNRSYETYTYISNTVSKELYRKCGDFITVIHSEKNPELPNGLYVTYKFYDEDDEKHPFKLEYLKIDDKDKATLKKYGVHTTYHESQSDGNFKAREEYDIYREKKSERQEKTSEDNVKNITKILSYVATIGGTLGTIVYNLLKLYSDNKDKAGATKLF